MLTKRLCFFQKSLLPSCPRFEPSIAACILRPPSKNIHHSAGNNKLAHLVEMERFGLDLDHVLCVRSPLNGASDLPPSTFLFFFVRHFPLYLPTL